MNILIIGCGQLGARLANVLDRQENDIAIIGQDLSLIDLIDDDFSGLTVQGNPIDVDVMRSAGIEGCDYIICVTESDNTNLMAAQIAKQHFHINHILARVLDPVKAQVYEQLGIFTVCPTSLAFESICAALFEAETDQMIRCGRSSLEVSTMPYQKWMKGKTLQEIAHLPNAHLIGYMDEENQLVLYSSEHNRPVLESDHLVFGSLIS